MKNAGLLSFLDQALVSGGTFLTFLFGAKLLTPMDLGRYGYVFSTYVIIVMWNMVLLFQWASVCAPKYERGWYYWSALTSVHIGSSIFTSALAALFLLTTGEFTHVRLSAFELLLIFTYLATQQTADYVRRQSYIFQDERMALFASGSTYPFRIALLLMLRPLTFSGFLKILIVTTLIPCITFLLQCLKYYKPVWCSEQKEMIGSHLSGTLHLIPTAPLAWLWNYLPLYFLGNLSGLGAVGDFVTVRSLANSGNTLMEVLETKGAAISGKLFANDPESLRPYLKRILYSGIIIWLGGEIIFIFHGNSLLKFLYGERFVPLSELLIILWVAVGVVFLFKLRALYLRTRGLNVAVLAGNTLAMAVVAAVGYPVINRWGISGAAFMLIFGGIAVLLGQNIPLAFKWRHSP